MAEQTSPGSCCPVECLLLRSALGSLRHLDRGGDAAADPVGCGAALLEALDGGFPSVDALAAASLDEVRLHGRSWLLLTLPPAA